MFKFMNDYYKDLKEEVGVESGYKQDKNDSNLDEIVTKLRPNSTASNFRYFI